MRQCNSPIIDAVIATITPASLRRTQERMAVAVAIADAIAQSGHTPATAARLLRVPTSTIREWTSGCSDVPTDALCHIEAALHVTLTLPDSLYA